MKDQELKQQKKLEAKHRAEVILKVRSGRLSASAGAKELGVSRKTYYQWEQRALEAMLKALTEKEPGRPQVSQVKKQEKKLQKLLEHQQKELEKFRHRENLIIEACELKLLLEKGELEKK